MANFLTSDTHAFHTNIIKFADRPFTSCEEMNETLIRNWNSVVTPRDTVYHLGDFGFAGVNNLRDFRERLNGKIILVIGNHDYKNILKRNAGDMFDEVCQEKVVTHNHVKCWLTHFPILAWPGQYRFEPNFHGHVHLKKNYTGSDLGIMRDFAHPCQYDVGVDLNGYRPITFDEAIEKVRYQVDNNINCYNAWCL